MPSIDLDSATIAITICFSLLGIVLIFAIHQARVLSKWRKIYRFNTWRLYRDISILHNDLKNLQQRVENKQGVSFELGKLTGHVQDMLDNQIRQIDINEHITYRKIEKWIRSGKIFDLSHRLFFKKCVDK